MIAAPLRRPLPDRSVARRAAARPTLLLAALAAVVLAPGCQSMSLGSLGSYCIEAIPARRLPPPALARSKDDLIETSKARLRQRPQEVYALGAGDVLGVYIEGVLGEEGAVPPVNFPEDASIPPSIGFPVPVREDGTVSLPLIPPVYVAGGTIAQAEEKVRQAYIEGGILNPETLSTIGIIITLQRQREVRVLVIREDAGGVQNATENDAGGKSGSGYLVDLKAGENDLLTALSATGGLPGNEAMNEAIIFKGGETGGADFDARVAAFRRQPIPCGCKPPLPDPYGPGAIRIPLRFFPEAPPTFTEEDIILEAGDIVYVPARDREKYYTGGVLGGGEYLLPRDYDLNILQAIAAARGDIGATGTGISGINLFGGRGGNTQIFPPSRAIVVRQLPNDCGEVVIEVDLARALTDPRERILIQPEDVIVVQYTVCEEIANTTISLLPALLLRGTF
ncbi:polysaccharide biosynthesis/export family protein [Alienimonas sp. DA493]|uniref:polysaccharide biosynthesis/export family protein n=1 Tax=Alienimonas sp. DA493 TaxID=3373605 RepID=UPI0037545B0C